MTTYLALAISLIALASTGCEKTDKKPVVSPPPQQAAEQVSFDTAGWTSDGPRRWRKSDGRELELTSSRPPAIELRDEARFRDMTRQEVLRRSGGLVSADVLPRGVGRVGRVVAKFPQKPSGMTYEGWLLVEREGVGHRISVRVPEAGMTGVRDTVVMSVRMSDLPEDADPMSGWMADPYDSARRDPLMKNVADDSSYDAKFPEHPLTLVRIELAALERSLRL